MGCVKKKIIFFFLILSLYVVNVSAHPGRTDSSGGHTDHSTGEYHYHHGYEAHDHINDQCPYEDIIDYENDYSSMDEDYSVNYGKIEKEKDSIFSSISNFIMDTELGNLVLCFLIIWTLYGLFWLKEWISDFIYARKLKKGRKKKEKEKQQ